MHVLDHLTREHREVEQMLEKLSEAEEGERGSLIDRLEQALQLHMTVEESRLYPLVEQVAGSETEEEAEIEHDLAREGIAKLREFEQKPGFGAVVDMVAAGIKHHVEEEENEIFPELRRKASAEIDAMDPEQLEAEAKQSMTAGTSNGSRRSRSSGSSSSPTGGPSKEELYEQAKRAGIEGRSGMTKDELQAALAKAR
jgi:hemerythrin-like domain-containing protein